MTASLARFLPDFELPGLPPLQAVQAESLSPPPPQPEIDIEAIRAQARAEGAAAARVELTRQHEIEREADKARHADQMAALRAELETFAAQSVPEAIAARSSGIAEQLAGDIAEIVTPLLDQTIRARILERLADEIRDALALETANQISVAGPEGMVDALCTLLGADAERIAVNHTEGFDIEIDIDRTKLTSRLSQWAEALGESLT